MGAQQLQKQPELLGVINKSYELDLTPTAEQSWISLSHVCTKFETALNELLDNCVSNLTGNGNRNKISNVNIYITDAGDHYDISIEDNGSGINDLNKALTTGVPVGDHGDSTLNEHGVGLKHALASINKNNDGWSIHTRTTKNGFGEKLEAPYNYSLQVTPLISGDEWVGQENYPTGTVIKVSCEKNFFSTLGDGVKGNAEKLDTLVSYLSEKIGKKYSTMIVDGVISFNIFTCNTKGVKNLSAVLAVEPKSIEQGMHDFGKGTVLIDGPNGQIKIKYDSSSIAPNNDYKLSYKGGMDTSGFEIRVNGRLMAEHWIKEIYDVENHNSYNHIWVKLDIIGGVGCIPKTNTSKDRMIESDPVLRIVLDWVLEKMPKLPKKLSVDPNEADLRDHYMKNMEIALNRNNEYRFAREERCGKDIGYLPVDGYWAKLSGSVPVRVLVEAKVGVTTPLNVMQLMMYWNLKVMDGQNPTEAILIGASHPESVKLYVEKMNTCIDPSGEQYNITLETWEGANIPTKKDALY